MKYIALCVFLFEAFFFAAPAQSSGQGVEIPTGPTQTYQIFLDENDMVTTRIYQPAAGGYDTGIQSQHHYQTFDWRDLTEFKIETSIKPYAASKSASLELDPSFIVLNHYWLNLITKNFKKIKGDKFTLYQWDVEGTSFGQRRVVWSRTWSCHFLETGSDMDEVSCGITSDTSLT